MPIRFARLFALPTRSTLPGEQAPRARRGYSVAAVAAASLLAWLSHALPPAPVITTVAGGGAGDGGAATSAVIAFPQSVALQADGTLYIADTLNNRIRKVAPGGTISTVAGDGTSGYSGDGGPATGAQLSSPTGVGVDASGNVYIADSLNRRIRKIDASGTISTVAGNGNVAYSGDGGPATAASIDYAVGLALDGQGNLYIADYQSSVVRKVDAAGIISTVAGNGTSGYAGDGAAATAAQLNNPYAVAVDAAGNLYIADGGNNRVRKVDANGTIHTIAGSATFGYSGDGGAATSAQLSAPRGVAVDAAGNVYIGDFANNVVRKVDAAGTISTFAGNGSPSFSGDGGSAVAAGMAPIGVATGAAGVVYIADWGNSRIRRVDAGGSIATIAGSGSSGFFGDNGPATKASLAQPIGVAFDAGGNLYVSDSGNNRVRKVSAAGSITTLAGNGIDGSSGNGGPATSAALSDPQGLTWDSNGNLYIADTGNSVVRKVDAAGTISLAAGNGTAGYSGDGGFATSAQLYVPTAVAVDAGGNLYIADSGNKRIRKVGANGVISTVAGNGTQGYSGDGGAATAAELSAPVGMAVDAGGNLYFADLNNCRVRKVDTTGKIGTVAGDGSCSDSGDGGPATSAGVTAPSGVAMDATGNLYIAELGGARIRKVDSSGVITTVAGDGHNAYSGDGGPAANAQLNTPTMLALDAQGNLYVSDQGNNRIRRVGPGFTIGGSVAGLAGNGLVLSLNAGAQTLAVAADGAFTFPGSLADGSSFSVSVQTQPSAPAQTCTVANGSGTINSASVTTVAVNCTTSIDGVCGSDNGKTLSSLPMNLCSAGTPSAVVGDGPWTWTCAGSNGGNTAACSAQATALQSATSLLANPNPATVGQTVTMVVLVNGLSTHAPAIADASGAAPQAMPSVGGTATVSDGANTCTATITNGSGSCTLSFAAAGVHHLTVQYSGDANYAGSTATLDVAVGAVNGQTGVVSAPALSRWTLLVFAMLIGGFAIRRLHRAPKP